MNTIRLNLKGRVCSKKNSRQNRKGRTATGKVYNFTVPSEAHECFKNDCIQQISALKLPQLKPPYFIRYSFFLKGKLDIDIDNAITSLNDLLQDKMVHIIDNDKNIVEVHARKISGNKDFHTELEIYDEHTNFKKG